MIRAADVAFHTPADVEYDWAETNYFSFYIPEANITAWLYVIARPGVGACVVGVQAIDKIGRLGLEALYVDFQQHLPMPAKLEDFTLPNGLTMKTFDEPRGYRIDHAAKAAAWRRKTGPTTCSPAGCPWGCDTHPVSAGSAVPPGFARLRSLRPRRYLSLRCSPRRHSIRSR